ncbi:MAG: integration host factor subunit beta [Gammaproteobacteria bacterium]|nr:integration host factor subunit beta [Gammaproteobacteria bacterium]
MTKADLVQQVADAIGPGVTRKDCALVVDGFLNAIKQAVASGENIEIRGFGTFKVRRRKARMARNPRTGDPVHVPAQRGPRLQAVQAAPLPGRSSGRYGRLSPGTFPCGSRRASSPRIAS